MLAFGAQKLTKVLLFNPRGILRRLTVGFRGDLHQCFRG
jgi:hypothetical protein